jgi:hypothetical protein
VLPEAAHSINWEQPETFNGNVWSLSVRISQQGHEDCHSD